MQMTIVQAHGLIPRHRVFVREACDKCGRLLGVVSYTRRDEAGEWCSRQCLEDAERQAIHRGERPRRYRTNAERQRAYRGRSPGAGRKAKSRSGCSKGSRATRLLSPSGTSMWGR
jgi:hypothetical protein